MEKQIKEAREAYSEQLAKLASLEPDDKGYDAVCKATESLSKQIQTLERIEFDSQSQSDNAEIKGEELRLKEEEIKSEKKNKYVRWAFDLAGLIVPVLAYNKFLKNVTNFEKEGIYGSSASRHVLSNFKFFKK